MIGEPHRAFYGNQYGLTFPLFDHYGVPLWVPEVGGPIDPRNEAHDLVMSVFGGMSKGERNRIKIRVTAAMGAQAKDEGRFLGGRPPYGYLIADAGPHPNPAKAADGKRLHKLDLDPEAAPVVRRIFAEFIAGHGFYAIAEGLTRDGIPSPSAHDPERNKHRSGIAWNKFAVRSILINPRYTGHQVWNKQRKDEVLIDVEDVALGHTTKLRWNETGKWLWSDKIVQPPIIDRETFDQVQAMVAGRAHTRTPSTSRTAPSTRTRCAAASGADSAAGGCKATGSTTTPYYRCRFPAEYALANHVEHPLNVNLREDAVIGQVDRWLAREFAPHRLRDTISDLAAVQLAEPAAPVDDHGEAALKIAECDRKLAQYRAALDAGASPATVAAWIAETEAEKAGYQITLRPAAAKAPADERGRDQGHRRPARRPRPRPARRRPERQVRDLPSARPQADLPPRKGNRGSASTSPLNVGFSKVSEGGLEYTKSCIFPDSALEYAGGGEIPCSGISCAHASGHARARVKRARRLRPQGRGHHPWRDCRAPAQSAEALPITAVGVPSNGRLAALIPALGRPPAQTGDTGGSGGLESARDIRRSGAVIEVTASSCVARRSG